MMIKTILLILILLFLLFPATSEAAYKIYLKDGSVISGVSFYEKKGGEITAYFSEGSMKIPETDILKIEGTESAEEGMSTKETPETQVEQEKPDTAVTQPQVPADDKAAKINSVKSELADVYSELKAVEEQEAKLVAEINEKSGQSVKNYNIIQQKQLEKEIEPLQKELLEVQMKKEELRQKKTSLEDELRTLQ
jgi:predicted RNase H-like nuclease (RuvC/YqgF family)